MRLQQYITEQNQFQLYVDMDGVLVNWIKGVIDIGLPKEVAKNTRIKKNQVILWGAIDELGATFWANLKWMPDGKKLWDYIKEYNPIILSAHSKRKGGDHWEKRLEVIQGKRTWLQKNTDTITAKRAIIVQRPDKVKYASMFRILIDDVKENIDEWKSKGGIGILHKNTASTIKELKKYEI